MKGYNGIKWDQKVRVGMRLNEKCWQRTGRDKVGQDRTDRDWRGQNRTVTIKGADEIGLKRIT